MFLVVMALASACSNGPNLIVGEAADSSVDVVEEEGAVADDSAPLEVGNLNSSQRPFLDYIEDGAFEGHIGDARFVLVDGSGEPLDIGTPPHERFSFAVSLYEGRTEPIVMTLGFSNFTVDADGRLDVGLCNGPWGQLTQRSASEYLFLRDRLPQPKYMDLAWGGAGCGPNVPTIEPAGIFDGAFEVEFGDDQLVLVSKDGTRWPFRQVAYELAAWDRHDDVVHPVPETTTTEVATTTTTTPADD